MFQTIDLESNKYWMPVYQHRMREEQLTQARTRARRTLWFATFTTLAVALLIAVALGAFDSVDVAGTIERGWRWFR